MSSTKIDPGTAKEELTAKPSADQIPSPQSAVATELEAALLIQIPDLNAADPLLDAEESSDGRIISQGLSNKLVMGIGFVLVLIAVLPFLVNKKRPQKSVSELPTWHASAPATTPATTPAYLTPQQPQAGANRPMALGDPGWPQAKAAPATSAQPENRQDRPADYRVGNAPEFQRNDRATDPQNLQADARSDPAAAFRGTAALRGTSTEPRADYRNDPPALGVAQGGAMMPAAAAGVVSSSFQDSQPTEPGVARFEGTIAKPPVRTSYDRAGSSNN